MTVSPQNLHRLAAYTTAAAAALSENRLFVLRRGRDGSHREGKAPGRCASTGYLIHSPNTLGSGGHIQKNDVGVLTGEVGSETLAVEAIVVGLDTAARTELCRGMHSAPD